MQSKSESKVAPVIVRLIEFNLPDFNADGTVKRWVTVSMPEYAFRQESAVDSSISEDMQFIAHKTASMRSQLVELEIPDFKGGTRKITAMSSKN